MVHSIHGVIHHQHHIRMVNMRRCNIPITPTFGEVTRATTEGTINDSVLGQLGIRVLHIDNMNHKLLVVHQVCDGRSQHHHQLDVFTNEGCRFFPLSTEKQTFQGLAQDGVYVHSPVAKMNKLQPRVAAGIMALHNVRDPDNFAHIHRVCGHMSKSAILWC